MRRLSVFLIFLLVFLTSCGIPSLRDFSSAVSFTTSYSNSFSLKFNSSAVNASYFINGTVNAASPSVILLYSVTNENNDSLASSFRSTFNKEIRGGGSYINGVPITIRQNDGILETTYGNKTYKLYPLMPEDKSSITPPGYTLSNGSDYVFSSLAASSANFSFSLEKENNTDDEYFIQLLKDKVPYKKLYRFNNGATFRLSDSAEDYRQISETQETYYIHIYAAVNVTKSLSSDFSNDYWTELRNVANIPIT